jgi:hypothetical protein
MVFQRLHVDGVNRAIEVSEHASGKSINVAAVLHTLGEDGWPRDSRRRQRQVHSRRSGGDKHRARVHVGHAADADVHHGPRSLEQQRD